MIEHSDRVMMRRCVVVLVACALFGCSSTPSAHGGSDSSPLAEAIGYDPMNGIFPVRQIAEIEAECIRSRGFAVEVQTPPPTTVQAESLLSGFLDAEPSSDFGEPYADYRASLSDGEAASFEDAFSACNQLALKEVYGAADGYSEVVGVALDEMYARVQSDPRALGVSNAYSGCMFDHGFGDRYDSPNAVGDELLSRADELVEILNENNDLSSSDPRVAEMLEFERSILSASATCAERTEFDSVTSEVSLDVQAEYLEEHPDFAQQVFGEATPS